jgi:hypothetical protein
VQLSSKLLLYFVMVFVILNDRGGVCDGRTKILSQI